MSSFTLYVVENDEDDRELFREMLTKLLYEFHLYTGAITFLTKPVFIGQWQRLLIALVAFWQWTHPNVRPLR